MSPRSDGNLCTWWENQIRFKGFMRKISRRKMVYISTLDDIGLWIDSKNNENLNSTITQSSGKELSFYGLGLE